MPRYTWHLCCNIFIHKWVISLSHKQSHDNSIIFIYFMTKDLDNFHITSMVMAPWVGGLWKLSYTWVINRIKIIGWYLYMSWIFPYLSLMIVCRLKIEMTHQNANIIYYHLSVRDYSTFKTKHVFFKGSLIWEIFF